MGKLLSLLSLSILLLTTAVTAAPPLSTSGRWIVDGYGRRVKLACVNWVAHMDVMVAEGLTKQALDDISQNILVNGFNCVRLTWPTYLVTDHSLVNVTVRQSFQRHGLSESIPLLEKYNPSMVDLPLLRAFKKVVISLVKHNLMVILNNYVSKPGRCCDASDGNAFFGDADFDPDVWLTGLSQMAALFQNISNVVGISLRNQLRGPRQNVDDWYNYMQKGAELVHAANPDVLVMLSGLNFGTDLTFLRKLPVSLSFTEKAVFERQWYAFSDGTEWEDGNPNEVCRRVRDKVMSDAGYLMEQGFPLFVSEFGVDQRGSNLNDNRYLDCFLATSALHDWDWALWNYVGSYYLRDGVVDMDEYFGAIDHNWESYRNYDYFKRITSLQPPFQGPEVGSGKPHKVLYHPQTGMCVEFAGYSEPPRLAGCDSHAWWDYTPELNLKLKGLDSCLIADGTGNPVKYTSACSNVSAIWYKTSDSEMHIETIIWGDGTPYCLDVVDTASNNLVTNPCKCLSILNDCDPSSQWFMMIDSA